MKINENYVLKEIEGEFIVIPLGQEAIDLNGVLKLNEVGAALFRELQNGITEEKLITFILKEYQGVDEARATEDVKNFIAVLTRHGVL